MKDHVLARLVSKDVYRGIQATTSTSDYSLVSEFFLLLGYQKEITGDSAILELYQTYLVCFYDQTTHSYRNDLTSDLHTACLDKFILLTQKLLNCSKITKQQVEEALSKCKFDMPEATNNVKAKIKLLESFGRSMERQLGLYE